MIKRASKLYLHIARYKHEKEKKKREAKMEP